MLYKIPRLDRYHLDCLEGGKYVSEYSWLFMIIRDPWLHYIDV